MARRASVTHLRSLNLERDQARSDILAHYVLTPNGLRAVRRILTTVAARRGGAWTITGPYGTGKSAFCLYLTHLLAPPSDSLTPDAVSRLRQVDPEFADALFRTSRSRLGFVPLVASGAREPFCAAVIRALASASAISSLPGGRAIQAEIKKLSRTPPAGSRSSVGIIAVFERLIAALTKAPRHLRGIVLILDELGKLLEHASTNPDEADVFLLQQLAELASRSDGRLLLLTVLHQDFCAYASALAPLERAEWEKIRGRYEDILFEEPASELLRFVARAWSELRRLDGVSFPPAVAASVQKHGPTLWRYDLAPAGLNQREGLKLLQDCRPLHPLVAVLLGLLFRRIGQNERSATTFLASEEPLALRAWIRRAPPERTLFDIDDLYEYLLASLGNGLLHTPDAKRWAEALEAEASHPNLSSKAVCVLRAIALLGICSRWYPVRPTHDVLAYALADRIPRDEMDKALTELSAASVVVRREHNGTYAIWEGSDIDIDARLHDGRERIGRTSVTATLLRKHHRVRPLLARRHSFERGTLRFFHLEFCQADELPSWADDGSTEYDGRILVVLPNGRQGSPSAASAKRFGSRTIVRVLAPDERLAELALSLAAIDWAWRNTPELSGDATARRELSARRMEVEKELDCRVAEFLRGADLRKGQWFSNGRAIRIRDGRSLNRLLSDIFDDVFHAAPRIDNEIINRQELSSAAAAARRVLIERMIERATEPELGLTGNPPERSIYRSVLSANGGLGLHREGRKGWVFCAPPKKSSADPLFRAIDAFLSETDGGARRVDELLMRLRQPPFGVRDGPLPVLLCAALLARDADVALYENGSFCPSLSTAVFERLMKAPEQFTVKRLRVTGVRSRVFQELERFVLAPPSRNADKRQLLRVVRPLLRVIASLPEYSRQTEEVSEATRGIRAVFLTAKEPETLLFRDLPTACGLKPFGTRDRGRAGDVRGYVEGIRSALTEMQAAYPSLLNRIHHALVEAFGVGAGPEGSDMIRNRAESLLAFAVERDLRMFLDRLSERKPEDDEWLEGVASLLAERSTQKWRDEDHARFTVRLQQFVRRFRLLEATIADRPEGFASPDGESIRLALTDTRFGQLDHAVHLDRQQAARADELQRRIERVIDSNGDPATIAALCRVLERRLCRPASSDSVVNQECPP